MEMKRTLKRYPNPSDMWDAANHYGGETLINVARSVGLSAKTAHANATRLKGVSLFLSLSLSLFLDSVRVRWLKSAA